MACQHAIQRSDKDYGTLAPTKCNWIAKQSCDQCLALTCEMHLVPLTRTSSTSYQDKICLLCSIQNKVLQGYIQKHPSTLVDYLRDRQGLAELLHVPSDQLASTTSYPDELQELQEIDRIFAKEHATYLLFEVKANTAGRTVAKTIQDRTKVSSATKDGNEPNNKTGKYLPLLDT